MIWYTIFVNIINYNKVTSQILIYNICLLLIQFLQNTNYNISLYHQLTNTLNTKINITIIIIMWIIKFHTSTKDLSFLNNLCFIIIYVNITIWDIYTNNNYVLTTSLFNINTNLLNGLMLVHPILLYFFYTFYLLKFKINLFTKYCKIWKWYSYNTKNITILLMIYISIILGCWWAEQELSWGGWWSWDLVELLALNFFIYLVVHIHNVQIQHTSPLQIGSYTVVFFFVLIIAIIVVRFNIINSIHNFLNIESQNQYFYYILILLLSKLFYLVLQFPHDMVLNINRLKKPFTLFTNNIFVSKNSHKGVIILNPFTFIKILFVILYVILLYNIYIIEFFHLNYNIQTSIKSIYFIILGLGISIIILNKKIGFKMNFENQ